MREIEYQGVTAYITEADWRNLLKRFDARNAKKDKLGIYFTVPIPCSLCKKHLQLRWALTKACAECPLVVFETGGRLGCIQLLQSIAPVMAFSLNSNGINWPAKKDKEARRQLARVHKALEALPRRRRR